MALSAADLQAFHATQLPQQAAPATKPSGNLLTHLFPTIGGIGGGAAGGAAGGALAGSAVLPGVGTAVGGLLGALLGGAAGGAAGKVAENKAESKNLGSGVGGQALEQGVLSAGPLRLLKGVSVAGKAAAGGSSSLLDALGQGGAVDAKLAAPGLLGNARSALATKGQQMEARAGGYGVGEKASGGVQLGVHDSAAIGDFLKSQGIAPGSPETRLAGVENKLGTVGKQIDTHLNSNNVTLQPSDVKSMAADYLKNVEMQPGVRPAVRKAATDFATNLENQVKDTKSLVAFRRGLDKQVINFNANGQGASPAAQIAARTLRDALTNKTNELAPGISDLNKSYSGLTDAAEFLKGGAKAISDQSQGGGGVISRVLTNDTAQAAKSRTGSVLQKVAAGGNAANPFSTGAISARSLPTGLVQALSSSSNTSNPTTPSTGNNNLTTNTATSNANMDTLSQPSDQMSSSPFDPGNIETNIEKIVAAGGTTKDVSDYVSLASAINSLQTAAAKSNTGATIKPTGQQFGLAQGGLNALQQLGQLIQQNPNVVNKNATPGQGLPLVGSLITNAAGAGDYHPLADNVLQSLIHLQTGATATPEEVKAARGQLPAPGDSPEEQQRKLSNLAAMFAPYIQGGQLGGNSGSLMSALGGAQ